MMCRTGLDEWMINDGAESSLVNGGAPDQAVRGGTKGYLQARKIRKHVRGVENTETNGGIGGGTLAQVGKEISEGP